VYPLDLIGDVLGSVCRRSLQKQMYVVGHHFERDDLAVEFRSLRQDQGTQGNFHATRENLAMLRTPDEVIGQRGNAATDVPVSFHAHNSIVRRYSIVGKYRKYQATDAVAALSLRMAKASGFPRKGVL
jgi:hypothetical protein